MTREEEREQAAKQSIKGDSFEDGCIGKGYFIIGAEWADKTMIAEIEKRMDDLYPQLPDASKVLNEDISIEEANTLGKYVALESLLSFIAKS